MSECIEKIYSKIHPAVLLHKRITKEAFSDAKFRINACEDREWLQLAILNLAQNQTFKPHKHIEREIHSIMRPHECWIVISGSVKVFYYDLDDKLMETRILNAGDVTMTIEGGHTYESLEDNTLVYEIKVPFYEGVEKDKVFI